MPSNVTSYFIQNCANSPDRSPYCPVFTIEHILEEAEHDPKERDIMLEKVWKIETFKFETRGLTNIFLFNKGGVIVIRIKWDCDFDPFASECLPSYSFTRYDYKSSFSSTVSGFNFRYKLYLLSLALMLSQQLTSF